LSKKICFECGEWFKTENQNATVCQRCLAKKTGQRGTGKLIRRYPNVTKFIGLSFLIIMTIIGIAIIIGIGVSLG
jgi:hypothetical protein